jgi:hypothetical protein
LSIRWSETEQQEAFTGDIGAPAATMFVTWLETMDMPTPREVLDEPALVSKVEPNRSDKLYYISHACVETIRRQVMRATQSPKNQDLNDKAVKDWLAGWTIAARILFGPMGNRNYDNTLEQTLAGKLNMKGPKDIGAVMANKLAQKESQPKGAKPPREVDLIPMITRAAGVNWTNNARQEAKRA